MKSFSEVIAEKQEAFGVSSVMTEADNGGAMQSDTGQSLDSEAPSPDATQNSMDSSTNIEQGASVNTKPLELPYKDLASIAYKALRMNFEDIDDTDRRLIEERHNRGIESDEDGLELITFIKDGLESYDGVDRAPVAAQ